MSRCYLLRLRTAKLEQVLLFMRITSVGKKENTNAVTSDDE